MRKLDINNIYNCIFGGAIGDALGYPVRDLSFDLIIDDYGKKGITDLVLDCDSRARITANTQLTIFTIDALIRAYTRYHIHRETDITRKITYNNYLRWQVYQNREYNKYIDMKMIEDSYLNSIQEIKSERCPEQRMINILENEVYSEKEITELNYNSGFAAITKAMPFGIVFRKEMKLAFDMSVSIAKLTHNDPRAYLSSGAYSVIIASIANGEILEKSIENALIAIKDLEDSEQVVEKIELAIKMSKDKTHYPEKFDDFGLCDESHEVLGAALYASLVYKDDISKALLFASNNSCYGNNIATLVGQILGLYKGLDDVTKEWIKLLEMSQEITRLVREFNCIIEGNLPNEIEKDDAITDIDEIKSLSKKQIAKWWVEKYDKI